MIESLKSIGDIYKKIPTEDAARRFLEDLIWPEGRVCPHCGEKHSTELRGLSHRPGLYQCRDCRKQFSVTTRTPLHATKLDLRVWVLALYIILNSSKGVSSVVLARMVGITQKAAWRIGHAVREMMWDSFEDGVRLDGVVEVDEAYVGGAPKFKQGTKNPRGRGTKKEAVLVAVERGGRARAAKMDANDAAHIRPLVAAWVDPSATLMTDSNQSYKAIGKLYDAHLMVKHGAKEFANPITGAHINTAEAFSAALERARVGVFHRITGYHTQRYLNELVWRWNHRIASYGVKMTKSGKQKDHIKWEPLPVVEMMRDLLKNAQGREIRRSEDYGIRWPGAALFGG